MFQFGLVPTINKPTRMTNKTVPVNNHIITNHGFNHEFKTAVKRVDQHLVGFFMFAEISEMSKKNLIVLGKRSARSLYFQVLKLENIKQKIYEIVNHKN